MVVSRLTRELSCVAVLSSSHEFSFRLRQSIGSSVVAGTLAPFDSNASYIHPLAPINPESLGTESIRPSSLSAPSDGSVLSTSSWDDDDDDSEDDLDDLDEIGSSDDDLLHKRVTRQSDKRRKSEQLPFSPRKTRQIVLNVDDEDGGSGMKKTTRSRQLKLRFKSMRHRGSDTDDDEEDEEDEYGGGRRNRYTSKRGGKGKSSKQLERLEPQYGCVRSVDDIDSDFFSDDESYPLRQHRKFCEKCHGKPSNVQLAAWKKRKGKKKRIDEFEEDEEDRFERLGGWIQWYVLSSFESNVDVYMSSFD